MRRIVKKSEPASFTSHRLTPGTPAPTFENMPKTVKKDTKSRLLASQGHLCCYCMDGVSYGDMRVERWATAVDPPTSSASGRS